MTVDTAMLREIADEILAEAFLFDMSDFARHTDCGTVHCIAGRIMEKHGYKFSFDKEGFLRCAIRPAHLVTERNPRLVHDSLAGEAQHLLGIGRFNHSIKIDHELEVATSDNPFAEPLFYATHLNSEQAAKALYNVAAYYDGLNADEEDNQ